MPNLFLSFSLSSLLSCRNAGVALVARWTSSSQGTYEMALRVVRLRAGSRGAGAYYIAEAFSHALAYRGFDVKAHFDRSIFELYCV